MLQKISHLLGNFVVEQQARMAAWHNELLAIGQGCFGKGDCAVVGFGKLGYQPPQA